MCTLSTPRPDSVLHSEWSPNLERRSPEIFEDAKNIVGRSAGQVSLLKRTQKHVANIERFAQQCLRPSRAIASRGRHAQRALPICDQTKFGQAVSPRLARTNFGQNQVWPTPSFRFSRSDWHHLFVFQGRIGGRFGWGGPGRGPKGGGPRRVGPRRVRAPKGGRPKFRVFSPLPPQCSSFLLSLGVLSCHFGTRKNKIKCSFFASV